ncbi:MAG: caspase family protein [Muribaculaceae bacterium]|nr:caspase family protein [Muribaculaceae bacterium]
MAKKLISIIGILVLVFWTGFYASGNPAEDKDNASNTEEIEEVEEVITPDSLLNRALTTFKELKFLKFEGEPLEIVSPMSYQCYEEGREALLAQEEQSREWHQAKELLRDTQRDLLEGAFFYSKASNQAEMTKFAQAYLDVSLLDAFKNDAIELDSGTLAMLAYISASGAYNVKEYARAIDYFKIYLSTGDNSQREQVYVFMVQSCLQAEQWDLGIATAQEALTLFPGHKHILLVAMQMCIDGGRGEHLQQFLTQALEANPVDERLLDIQGKLYEDAGDYEKALSIYTTLEEIRPNSLSTAKHIALCYYNQAVDAFNSAINQSDEKAASRLRRRAKNYFASASDKFRDVLESAPTSVPYLRSLGVCYLCLEDKYNFEKINERLRLLGEDPLAEVFMPPSMTYNGDGKENFATSQGSALKDAPSYSDFGREYITTRLGAWAKKGEFERMDDFNARVNQTSIRAEYNKLKKEAADKYLAEYSSRLRINDLALQPYDAGNEVFKIVSSYGPIYLRVPLKNGEAEQFKDGWKAIRFQNPKFFIDDDSVRIAEITFIAANGKKYEFNNARAINYSVPDIAIDFASILGTPSEQQRTNRAANDAVLIAAKSDVDENIPETKKKSNNTLALIIANENYRNVSKVPSAYADGLTFSEYCRKTLGIPERNISFYPNASLAEIYDAMVDLQRKSGVVGSNAEIIVYYAGHGLPDENSKEAYLLASDSNPTNSRTWYKLSDFYQTLSELNAQSVMVFLDACFSGAERSDREGATIMAQTGARGAVIKPKEAAPKGNMFVLTAASGNETALPYTEKNHGLFTYYLLKKIQDSKGNVTLRDLADYVTKEVSHQSNFVNKKPQTPTAVTSGLMTEMWKSKKLVP